MSKIPFETADKKRHFSFNSVYVAYMQDILIANNLYWMEYFVSQKNYNLEKKLYQLPISRPVERKAGAALETFVSFQ